MIIKREFCEFTHYNYLPFLYQPTKTIRHLPTDFGCELLCLESKATREITKENDIAPTQASAWKKRMSSWCATPSGTRMWETRRRTPFPYPAAPPKPPASKLGLPHIRLMLLSVTPFRGTSLCSCPTALRLFLAVTLLRQGFEGQARSFGLSRRGFFLIRSKTEF